MSLVSVSPLMALLSLTWYVYLMMMLFLSGVFVLVLYVSTFTSFYMKSTGSYWWLLLVSAVFPNFVYFYTVSWSGISSLFMSSNLGLVLFLILFLVFLIVWTSYMLTGKGAMRKF